MTRPVVRLPENLREEIVAHCLSELPNEGCGLLAMDDDEITKVYPTLNEDRSPVAYTIPPQAHFDALADAESRGWQLGGAFHSHPSGPARMSPTDLTKAMDRDWVYLVVGLDGGVQIGCWRDGDTIDLA
jgi:[CysO sulfur-carrier protein]-S-L-cysteine hydrolase